MNLFKVLICHIVDRGLTLSPALLSCHWQVVRLVHRELVWIFLQILTLRHRIFQNLVHLNFIAHTGWRV